MSRGRVWYITLPGDLSVDAHRLPWHCYPVALTCIPAGIRWWRFCSWTWNTTRCSEEFRITTTYQDLIEQFGMFIHIWAIVQYSEVGVFYHLVIVDHWHIEELWITDIWRNCVSLAYWGINLTYNIQGVFLYTWRLLCMPFFWKVM